MAKAVKKSELYSSLWDSCDQLRGSMDASQYKDYVLTLLFVKYVSDNSRIGKNDHDGDNHAYGGGSQQGLESFFAKNLVTAHKCR